MVYRFFKWLMTIALRLFYRRMYVTGLEAIPPKGPAILLANHPSALMDAAIVGILMKRPVYFFTKGDVFVNKAVNAVMDTLHMIPIHQHTGAKSSVNINDESYIKAEEVLSAGGIILFFPEGNSKTDHRLEPLRKGVFRMAFYAAEKNDFRYDIPFVPVGINYQHPVNSNKDVMVNFDKPFFLSTYRKDYEANPAATLLRMTKEAFDILEKKVLHIADAKDFKVAEECLAIDSNNYSFHTSGWLQATIRRFAQQKEICDRINTMNEEDKANLSVKSLQDKPASRFQGSLYILLIPLALTGWLLNALPIAIARRIANTKVTRLDFYSWVFVVSGALLYVIWLIVLFIMSTIISWKYGVAVVLLTLLSGIAYHKFIASRS